MARGDLGVGLQVDGRFVAVLGAHSVQALEAESGAVVGIWPDGRIAFSNGAWQRFALSNAGADVLVRWPLGADLLSGISGGLRDYYASAFARALARGEAWEQTYACHSPRSTRQFQMRVLPLAGRGLLLIHSLVAEAELEILASGDAERYFDADGVVRQCSNCRRTQRVGAPAAWDWVPAFVASCPPRTSHSICSACINQYYPEFREAA